VQSLARFHAAWWGHPRFDVSVGRWLDANVFERDLRGFAKELERFTDRFGELMPPKRRDLYKRLLDQVPRLLARYHFHRNLTIIRGDAHSWNFFLPRDGAGNGVRLIDWESWTSQRMISPARPHLSGMLPGSLKTTQARLAGSQRVTTALWSSRPRCGVGGKSKKPSMPGVPLSFAR